jgi:hypothetical protein
MSAGPRLGQIKPRERAGAQTGRKYEYQYERTARAALDLLSDGTPHICVYCDWHDDYVIETGNPPTRYIFHQVKGRTSSQGPWSFREFFGVSLKKKKGSAKKPATVNETTVAPRMLLHYQNFSTNCAGVAFVTNVGIEPELRTFLEAVAHSATVDDLPADARIAFDHLAQAYAATAPPLSTAADLFTWIQGMKVHTDQGQMENADIALLEIAVVVEEYSEIDLGMRQAKQIAREIVGRVRSKVANDTTAVPAHDEQLRGDKGIVVGELLGVLSLSPQAYEALKAGEGKDAVKTVSRLQRFCAHNDAMRPFLVQICACKAKWDAWRTVERHNLLNNLDYVQLEVRAHEVLQTNPDMTKVITEAKDIAKQFAALGVTPLTPEHVVGLIFSLAAQSEALAPAS